MKRKPIDDRGPYTFAQGDELERRLLPRIRAGETAALAELYDQFHQLVYSVSFRILGDAEAAEEVAIDVFYELWSRIGRFDRRRGRLATYILLLTRCRAIDRKRQRTRRAQHTGERTPLISAFEPANGEPTPLECIELEEQRVRVREALKRVRAECREPLRMSFLDGHSHSEIAQRLDIAPGTVKTRIRSGLIQLRQLLRMFDGEEWPESAI